jgi:hypothetical protein
MGVLLYFAALVQSSQHAYGWTVTHAVLSLFIAA